MTLPRGGGEHCALACWRKGLVLRDTQRLLQMRGSLSGMLPGWGWYMQPEHLGASQLVSLLLLKVGAELPWIPGALSTLARACALTSCLSPQDTAEDIHSIDSCEYIWEAGVGFAHSPQPNYIHDLNR